MPILRLLTAPFSFLYYIGLSLDRFFRTRGQVRLPKPVISVGNLTVGGTGKTPLLIRLVNDLNAWKIKPAVLSRGYRGVGKGSVTDTPNDETWLVMEKCPDVPVGVGPDRAAQAKKLLEKHAIDVFLLDDGFQHWSIHRDLDIVCIDATKADAPWLLPFGRWREPLPALSRAQVAVITRSELVLPEKLKSIKARVQQAIGDGIVVSALFQPSLVEALTEKSRPWSWLSGKHVLALSAIGNPDAFEEGLKKAGAQVSSIPYPDHFAYDGEDWNHVASEAALSEIPVITTEKDWVKLKGFVKAAPSAAVEVLIARITVRFSGEDEQRWEKAVRKVFA